MTALPNAENVDLIWSDQIRGGSLHCFKRAGLMAQQTHEYGYHADPWEAQARLLWVIRRAARLSPWFSDTGVSRSGLQAVQCSRTTRSQTEPKNPHNGDWSQGAQEDG